MSIDLIDPALCTGCRICVLMPHGRQGTHGGGYRWIRRGWWADCRASPCSRACPGSLDIPGILAAVRDGDLDAAALISASQQPVAGHHRQTLSARVKLRTRAAG